MHDHLLPVICGTSVAGIAGTLALAGLVGSAAHCAGMCGPFVLAQTVPDSAAAPGSPNLLRLVRAATLPYHLGRMTTYTMLGALAGEAGATVAQATMLVPVFRIFLLAAALFFLLQAIGGRGTARVHLPPPIVRKFGALLARIVQPLVRGNLPGGFALGITLGFLPCGLLYGALMAAAGSGSAVRGALAMAAFCVGTMPSLILVGCGAHLLAARSRRWAQAMLAPLQIVTAATLIFFALSGVGLPF